MCSHSLMFIKVDLLRVNKELEEELFSLKKAEQRLVEKEREANRLRTETERQLEEKECEVQSIPVMKSFPTSTVCH